MNRRELLKSFLPLAAGVAVAAKSVISEPTPEGVGRYDSLYFTGWKPPMDQAAHSWLVAQWVVKWFVAGDSRGHGLYVSMPGLKGGRFRDGYTFDISFLPEAAVEVITPAVEVERIIAAGLNKMVELCREHNVYLSPALVGKAIRDIPQLANTGMRKV